MPESGVIMVKKTIRRANKVEQISLFAEENRLQKLSELGDSLERLNVINREMFRPELKNALHKERKSNAGRPPYDCVLLFKTLVLQRIYNLSDDQTEYQINDIKSKTGCRIEHVFGYMTVSIHGLTLRSVGIKRAEFNIGLTNLVYNICRYSALKREGCVMG